jgi:hypothetical protein
MVRLEVMAIVQGKTLRVMAMVMVGAAAMVVVVMRNGVGGSEPIVVVKVKDDSVRQQVRSFHTAGIVFNVDTGALNPSLMGLAQEGATLEWGGREGEVLC